MFTWSSQGLMTFPLTSCHVFVHESSCFLGGDSRREEFRTHRTALHILTLHYWLSFWVEVFALNLDLDWKTTRGLGKSGNIRLTSQSFTLMSPQFDQERIFISFGRLSIPIASIYLNISNFGSTHLSVTLTCTCSVSARSRITRRRHLLCDLDFPYGY